MSIDPRARLQALIEERQEDYAALSRLIGRNAAYIQQFVKRGVPRRLSEDDRRTLARYFGVAEADLGGPREPDAGPTVQIVRLDVTASAGHGSFNKDEGATFITFDARWLRALGVRPSNELAFIRVRGDSMFPTLADGDDILLDQADTVSRLRDGIYVLRREESLLVKRVALGPNPRLVNIKSDNPSYSEWRDVDVADVEVLGRVLWAGRRF